jgi:hypothetical protein
MSGPSLDLEPRPAGQPRGEGEEPEPTRQPGGRGPTQPAGEVDGPKGLEPTRFGDWEKNGRCSDF